MSDDSSAQGRGLSSATTVYLQAPSQTILPKPDHRPNCRCPVNNTRVVVGNLCLGGKGMGGMGAHGTPSASLLRAAELGEREQNGQPFPWRQNDVRTAGREA